MQERITVLLPAGVTLAIGPADDDEIYCTTEMACFRLYPSSEQKYPHSLSGELIETGKLPQHLFLALPENPTTQSMLLAALRAREALKRHYAMSGPRTILTEEGMEILARTLPEEAPSIALTILNRILMPFKYPYMKP